METKLDDPLLSTWSAALASVGITGADVLPDSTGNTLDSSSGAANFRWGVLVLRLLRDRGQDFVDVAPASLPARWYGLDDVGIAQGWRSVESVIARQEPVALVDELRDVARHRAEIERAFAPDRLKATDTAIAEARKQRERAFLEKLKRLADVASR